MHHVCTLTSLIHVSNIPSICIWITGVSGITVTMNHDVTGTAGENGTYLECSYTKENVSTVISVVIEARIRNAWQQIINFPPGHPTRILSSGSYLVGRVTFNNLTQKSNKAMLIFNKLLCEDETYYKCVVGYIDIDLVSRSNHSESTRIMVQVNPSVPKLSYSASTNSGFENETVEDRNCSSNGKQLKEGDSILILCEGNVGKPAGNLSVQIIQTNGSVYNLSADGTVSILDNCSFYHRSNFTKRLTAGDDGGLLKCAVEFFTDVDEISNKSGPLDVKYPVRIPYIETDPNNQSRLPVTLNCSSTGNPLPTYEWYRNTNNTSDMWEIYASGTQNITLTNVSDSGLYKCTVSNTVGCTSYRQSITRNINFTESSPTTPTVLSTVGGSNESKLDKEKDILPVIIGVSVGGVLLIVVAITTIILYRSKRKPEQHTNNDKVNNHLVHQLSGRQFMGDNNYSSVSPDDNGDGKKSRKENVQTSFVESKGRHQPVEYALVNKSRKIGSNRNEGYVNQPTEYAQVNKVKKRTSNELPMDNNPYASGQGIYDHAHDRRHKQPKDFEPYDTTSNISRRSEKVGAVGNNIGKPIKQKQVAKIKPSGRSGYENAGMESDDILKTNHEPNTAL